MRIHHLALAAAWAEAQESGTYSVSTLGLDLADVGFIHCSRPEQVQEVHERFYADVKDHVILLTIDTDLLTSPWQFDEVPGAAMTFPHIYGPLNTSAVLVAEPYESAC